MAEVHIPNSDEPRLHESGVSGQINVTEVTNPLWTVSLGVPRLWMAQTALSCTDGGAKS